MRAWLQRLMAGRYGGDHLGRFLCVVSLVLLVLARFSWGGFYYLGLGLLVYSYYRMFSRNLTARYAEERWYLGKRAAVLAWYAHVKQRFALRRQYRYFRCPYCRQTLRLPRGRGRISIHCPKCGTQFVRKS